MHLSTLILLQDASSSLVDKFGTVTEGTSIIMLGILVDGTIAMLNNPSATFVNPGFYTVKLVANGATSSDSIISIDYIHVLDKPYGKFNLQHNN